MLKTYVKLKNAITKEKQFNKKVEYNQELNKFIKSFGITTKDNSSGNDDYEYKSVYADGFRIGVIQYNKRSNTYSIYEYEEVK